MRAGARVGAHPVQLGDAAIPERPGELERRARPLPDGSLWSGGGATGEFPDAAAKPSLGGPRRPNGIYVIRVPQHEDGPQSEGLHARLRIPGRRGGPDFNWSAPGYGEAFKKARPRSGQSTLNLVGLRRVPARFDNFVAIDPERRRRVRHPGAAHHV